jgi:hypothetical protein
MRQEKAEKEVEKIVSESEKKRHRNAARLIEGGSEKSKSGHQRSAEK